jgi:Ran GTPase-activating protein (RanGAP) involved in mRNA processing and transport
VASNIRAITEAAVAAGETEFCFKVDEDHAMGVEGAKIIASEISKYPTITMLALEGQDIGDDGAVALADVLASSSLTTLSLPGNKIGADGARAIATAISGSNLAELALWDNDIGDDGATAIAEILTESKLTALWLDQNTIGDKGASAIASALPGSRLLGLGLMNNQFSGRETGWFSSKSGPRGELVDAWTAHPNCGRTPDGLSIG